MLGHAKAVGAGLVLVLAAGCGASSNSSSTSTQSSSSPKASSGAAVATKLVVDGKHTTLAFTPAAASELRAAGVSVSALAPATIAKPALVNFPIYVGHLTLPGLQGTISHHGGLTFTHAGKSVTASDLVMNTAAGLLTAIVDGGQRVPLLHLTIARPSPESNGEFFLNGIVAKLTKTTALLLDQRLAVTVFKDGQQLGTVSSLVTGMQS